VNRKLDGLAEASIWNKCVGALSARNGVTRASQPAGQQEQDKERTGARARGQVWGRAQLNHNGQDEFTR
jgi:hypothetical protein